MYIKTKEGKIHNIIQTHCYYIFIKHVFHEREMIKGFFETKLYAKFQNRKLKATQNII